MNVLSGGSFIEMGLNGISEAAEGKRRAHEKMWQTNVAEYTVVRWAEQKPWYRKVKELVKGKWIKSLVESQ